MSEDAQTEALSALVDGELPDARRTRAVDSLVADPRLHRKWARYHLIGAAMRGEVCATPDASMSERVSAALAAEPVLLAPRRSRARVRPLTGVAIAASVAAAAVVALRLFLGTGSVHEEGQQAGAVPVASVAAPRSQVGSLSDLAISKANVDGGLAASRQRVAGGSESSGLESAARVVRAGTIAQDDRPQLRIVAGSGRSPWAAQSRGASLGPDQAARLNRYLVNHTGSAGAGMRGMFPYAALVSYESQR